jgi:hypothetical protein
MIVLAYWADGSAFAALQTAKDTCPLDRLLKALLMSHLTSICAPQHSRRGRKALHNLSKSGAIAWLHLG